MDIDAQIAALQALKASQTQQPAASAAPAQAAPPQAAPPQPAAAPAFDYNAMAQAFVAAQQAAAPAPAQQAAPRPAPAAAPSAPFANGYPTANGVVDIFVPGVAAALGPSGVRENLEKLWKIEGERTGRPTRPKPPGR